MNNEENDNHILIEVLNKNGDLKLTKFRNPRVIWQNNDYPDEYIFRDVDIVNIFQLQKETKQLKEENEFLKSEIEEAKRIIQKYLEYIDERDERINKSIDYIENHSLYEEEYDYDYEENSYLSGIDDETAKKDLLKILREEDLFKILKEVE